MPFFALRVPPPCIYQQLTNNSCELKSPGPFLSCPAARDVLFAKALTKVILAIVGMEDCRLPWTGVLVLILMPPKIGCEFSAQEPRVHRTAKQLFTLRLYFIVPLDVGASVQYPLCRHSKAFLTRKRSNSLSDVVKFVGNPDFNQWKCPCNSAGVMQ